jgi:galactose mutarotase-like enzyme
MQHQLISNQLTVSINALGAELCSVKDTKGVEFIWQANKAVWARHAPVLFPIVGKLKDDAYSFENQFYQLSQHGFARDLNFDLIASSNSTCTFRLQANEKTKQHFPFEFVLDIKYSLDANALKFEYLIFNPDSKNLYFSIGAHPAFNIPLEKSEVFEDYSLQFSANTFERTTLQNGLISSTTSTLYLLNKQLHLSTSIFNEDALVFENNQIDEISLFSTKSAHKITINCKNWPFFGIWSKKGCKEFLCLEPWYGIADSVDSNQILTEKKGIICLESQKTFTCAYSIAFE